jgi:hypothetical protein
MFLPSWCRFVRHSLAASRQARRRRPRALPLRCEQLEPRWQPSAFSFSTGNPDGRIATVAEPPGANNGNVEFETADDFVLPTETQITQATFTGLVTGLANPVTAADVANVVVNFYQVFPKGSDPARAPAVPTRVNSPADVELVSRDSAGGGLSFTPPTVLNPAFTAQKSVQTPARIAVNSGGDGPVTGQEVQFTVTFTPPLDLPPDHYFFDPEVGLVAAGAHFLMLSAPRPIVPPGTPFAPDLQAWERDNPGTAPDWLRIGTDIIGGTTFNESFSLTGQNFPLQISSLSQNAAAEGSGDVTLTVNGSNFTNLSTVLFNGVPLTTTFLNAQQLQALIPAALLADEGTANVTVADAQRGLSNAQTFAVTENVPSVSATVTQSRNLQGVTIKGQVFDQAPEGHRVRIDWGDGTIAVVDLGVSRGGAFAASHHYTRRGPRRRTVKVTALDDEGTASAVLTFSIRVHR